MDPARADSARGEVVLREVERDGRTVLELRVNGLFVMDDVETTSERALAAEALRRCPGPSRVLVGGLGLGFTLAEVLLDDRVERVVVVEIEEAVAGWMADGTVPHGPALLADPRVEVVVADVASVLVQAGAETYDLVLLDVDNGPAHLVHQGNAALYRHEHLGAVRRALAPGGLAVVWSMAREDALLTAMRDVFGAAEAVAHDVVLDARDGTAGRDETYWLHLAHAGGRGRAWAVQEDEEAAPQRE